LKLDAKTIQQLDLFQNTGSAAEFSPLAKVARGQFVDLDELKGSVIRAMGHNAFQIEYYSKWWNKERVARSD
jgi:hypothetical protein